VERAGAPAADGLRVAGGVGPGLVQPMADDLRVDVEERLAHRLGEGEVALEVAGAELVVEDAADAARLAPVRQEEVLVAPGLEPRIPLRIEGVARALQRGV